MLGWYVDVFDWPGMSAVIGTVLVISDVQLSQCMDGLDPDSEILCTGRSDRRCLEE